MFNTWFPVGGIILETLESKARWEEVGHGEGGTCEGYAGIA